MNLSDPQIWKDGMAIVVGAPHVVGPALGFVSLAVWWLRGFIEKGAKNELKERTQALEERLHLAKDKETGIRTRLEMAEYQLDKMRFNLSKISRIELKDIASATTSTISEILLISKELSRLLTASTDTP